VVIAAVVLGEGISAPQAFGGLAILGAAVVIARSHTRASRRKSPQGVGVSGPFATARAA
jgi:hypothetical protein